MNRSPLVSVAIRLALSVVLPLASVPTAFAQDDRDQKEERRVLKLSDMDSQSKSEAFRQMEREKRHEAMNFLKDILTNRAPQGTQKAEMMLRLAELYYEEYKDIRLDEDRRFQEAFDKCFNTAG